MSVGNTVAEIWTTVLKASTGDGDATFFTLGGESIAAVRLVTRIEDELGVTLDVSEIFEDDPTLAELIAKVDAATAAKPAA
jgi:acyl carrier protein